MVSLVFVGVATEFVETPLRSKQTWTAIRLTTDRTLSHNISADAVMAPLEYPSSLGWCVLSFNGVIQSKSFRRLTLWSAASSSVYLQPHSLDASCLVVAGAFASLNVVSAQGRR